MVEEDSVLLQDLLNVVLEVLDDLDGELLSLVSEDGSVDEAVGSLADLLHEVVLEVAPLGQTLDISQGEPPPSQPNTAGRAPSPVITVPSNFILKIIQR